MKAIAKCSVSEGEKVIGVVGKGGRSEGGEPRDLRAVGGAQGATGTSRVGCERPGSCHQRAMERVAASGVTGQARWGRDGE